MARIRSTCTSLRPLCIASPVRSSLHATDTETRNPQQPILNPGPPNPLKKPEISHPSGSIPLSWVGFGAIRRVLSREAQGSPRRGRKSPYLPREAAWPAPHRGPAVPAPLAMPACVLYVVCRAHPRTVSHHSPSSGHSELSLRRWYGVRRAAAAHFDPGPHLRSPWRRGQFRPCLFR